jgi:1L-myo-inositol 1-phosphate cytidylyltransferase
MNFANRTGVILAAGFGSRLAGHHRDTELKPLTPVAGRPLLLRTIRSLSCAGCPRVVIVVGHGGEEVAAEVRGVYQGNSELIFAQNDRYELGNGVSVLAAAPHVTSEFILTMADHVFGDEVMEIARTHHPVDQGATLLVDHQIDTIFDMDDATKVLRNESNQIVAIGKTIKSFNCIDTGIFVCTKALMKAIDDVYQRTGDASLSDGVQHLANQGRMHTLDIGDGFWQDVDTPEMLGHAEAMLRARQSHTPRPTNLKPLTL